MSNAFFLLAMIFFHIVDDYYLQGWLASAKQREWWEKNAPNELYKHDYLIALVMHSMSWSFMILLPLAILNCLNIDVAFIVAFFLNSATHAFVDNLKANKKKINLIQDQIVHVVQIIISFVVLTK